MRARARASGIQRILVVTWRDLDDPEAGGSEEHSTQVCAHLALAGLDVTLHAARVKGLPARAERDGFKLLRRGGRLGVFATTPLNALTRRTGRFDGVIEIFHAAPFFAPLWTRKPQVGIVHHVHLGTWHMLLPGPLGKVGEFVEKRLLPPVYRRRRLVTAAPSARTEMVEHYGVPSQNIDIAYHGVDERFCPGGERSARPLIVAVGRMMPQKGFDQLLDALDIVKEKLPEVEAVIIGDGPYKQDYEARAQRMGGWIQFAGRVSDDELVEWYRRAWVAASASKKEGFGLTCIEAAACGTPMVASRISGHVDAVDDGVSGFLADDPREMASHLVTVLTDDDLRATLQQGALEHATKFTWVNSAAGLLNSLCDEADRRRRK